MNNYRPEGCLYQTALNQKLISTTEGLREAMEKDIILEAKAVVCDSGHNLIAELPCGKAVIPREEGAIGIKEGFTRDIALISRVNKIVCFKVTELSSGSAFTAILSRKAAQLECTRNYIEKLMPGDVIDAKVTHLEQFGCFVDIGCGLPSLIPIDTISVSRISHPADRFRVGDNIRAVIKSNSSNRICLSHKELLGTWEENAAAFEAGETVSGIVRSIEEYGVFVELAPNLAGLAEPKPGVKEGQSVSVYIKALIPEKMKVKLIIVDTCQDIAPEPAPEHYYFTDSHIDKWQYAPESSGKDICTVFSQES